MHFRYKIYGAISFLYGKSAWLESTNISIWLRLEFQTDVELICKLKVANQIARVKIVSPYYALAECFHEIYCLHLHQSSCFL